MKKGFGIFYPKSYRVERFSELFSPDISVEMAVEKFDKEYFNTYSLFIIYVSANSGSYRYEIEEAIAEGENYNVYVKQANNPENVTDNLACWFIMLTTQKSQIEGCTVFDAQMVS